MTRNTLITVTLSAAILLAAAPNPAEAGGSFGIHVSNHGAGIGFGGSNWGIWGSSWNSGHVSAGFSTSLDGYGEWVWVGDLGRVWRPWVAAGWQPYSHGRWVWTSMGWTWVAYEPWGWVPHHYGNWAFTTVGWVWTPGYSYHPGNVVWVNSGAYIGWVPCAPRGWSHAHRAYDHGWHNGYRSGRYDGYNQGYEDGWRDARYATWVPRNQVTSDNLSHHAVGHEVATRSVARSRIVPQAAPPSKTNIERMVGRSVPEARIVERTQKINGRDVRIVRPEGQSDTVRRHGAETVKTALAPSVREMAVAVRTSGGKPTAGSPRTTTVARRSDEAQRSHTSRAARAKTQTHTTTTTTSRRSVDRVPTHHNRAVEPSKTRAAGNRTRPPEAAVTTTSRRVAQRSPQTQPSRTSTRTTSPAEPVKDSANTRTQRSTDTPAAARVENTRTRTRSANTDPEREKPVKRRQRNRN